MAVYPKIKGYDIKKKLGEGGMASVFLGIQKKPERMVALKVYVPNVFGDQGYARRFLKEGRILSRFHHPNIVTVYDVGHAGHFKYIAMEYLQRSLKTRIQREGRISPQEAVHIVLRIANALFYIHKKGEIHRDIKPENIMFRSDDTPVLLDFGIVKTVGAEAKLTRTGVSIGTPQYMSPEQCAGSRVDGRTDFYSLGVVFFEMLTGKVPYTGRDTRGIVLKHLRSPLPQLPFGLKKYQVLIERLLVKKKSDRLRSQRELNTLAKELLKDLSGTPRKKEKRTGKRGRKSPAEQKTMISRRPNTTTSRQIQKPAKRRISSVKRRKKRSSKRVWKTALLLTGLILALLSLYLFVIKGYTVREVFLLVKNGVQKILFLLPTSSQ